MEEPPRKKAEKPKDERDAFTRWAEKKLGLNRSAAQIKKDMKKTKELERDPAYGKDFGGDSQAHYNSYQHELEVHEAIRDAVNRINEAPGTGPIGGSRTNPRQDDDTGSGRSSPGLAQADSAIAKARKTRKDIDAKKQRDADQAQDAPGASSTSRRRSPGSQTGSGTSTFGAGAPGPR